MNKHSFDDELAHFYFNTKNNGLFVILFEDVFESNPYFEMFESIENSYRNFDFNSVNYRQKDYYGVTNNLIRISSETALNYLLELND
jgi:hypothetical protein